MKGSSLPRCEGIVGKNKGKEMAARGQRGWRTGYGVLREKPWKSWLENEATTKSRGSLECHARHWPFLSTEVAVEGLEVRITIIICILGGILMP